MLKAGTVLGNYEIIAPIGAGGMGVVYHARHTLLSSDVALKVLLANYSLSSKVRARFRQEAYVQANLKHPNIVHVTDLVLDEDTLAIVMELVEGPSLEDVLTDEMTEPWSVAETMALMEPVLDAVAHAHRRGVVHRDLKPANVMLDRSRGLAGLGVVKVGDFGLAKILTSDIGMTRTGAKMGTVPYMAPEQFEGSKEIDARADVFALGMMFWRLLAGRTPVDPEDMRAIFSFYMGENAAPSLLDVEFSIPEHISQALERALSRDPNDRYDDAGMFKADLGFEGERTPGESPKPSPTTPIHIAQPGLPSGSDELVDLKPSRPISSEDVLSGVSLCGKAKLEANAGNLEKALRMFREAVCLDPSNHEANERAGEIENQVLKRALSSACEAALTGNVGAAKSNLDRLNQISSQSVVEGSRPPNALAQVVEGFLIRTDSLEAAGEIERAMSLLEEVEKTFGSVPAVREKWESLASRVRELGIEGLFFLRIDAALEQEQWGQALKQLAEARQQGAATAEVEKRQTDAFIGLANGAITQGNTERASHWLAKAHEISGPNDARIRVLQEYIEGFFLVRIDAALEQKQWRQALKQLAEARQQGVSTAEVERRQTDAFIGLAKEGITRGTVDTVTRWLAKAQEISGGYDSRIQVLREYLAKKKTVAAPGRTQPKSETPEVKTVETRPGDPGIPTRKETAGTAVSSRRAASSNRSLTVPPPSHQQRAKPPVSQAKKTTTSDELASTLVRPIPLRIILAVSFAVLVIGVIVAKECESDHQGAVASSTPQETGRLNLNSNVSGASILVDDETVATTQAERQVTLNLLPGRHQVVVRRGGWSQSTHNVRVAVNQTTVVNAELFPESVSLGLGFTLVSVGDDPLFYLMNREITVGDFRECLSDDRYAGATTGGYRNHEDHSSCNLSSSRSASDLPMNCINQETAEAYCAHYGMRLPSDNEWTQALVNTRWESSLWQWTSTVTGQDWHIVRDGPGDLEGPDNIDSDRASGTVRSWGTPFFTGARCAMDTDNVMRLVVANEE